MDQWKTAFKQIYGKTPTKQDFSLAPASIQASLPQSPGASAKAGPKRKRLTLKMDPQFSSPKKMRKITPKVEPLKETTTNVDLARVLVRPCDPSSSSSLLSPVKQWTSFLASPAGKVLPPMSPLSALLKTPSPARLRGRAIFCANVGHLLTPEKPAAVNDQQYGFENEEEEEEPITDAPISDTDFDGIKMDENGKKNEEEKEQKRRTTTRKVTKKQREPGNFVSINLRRKRFVRSGKFNGKKNWRKKRWMAKGGGR